MCDKIVSLSKDEIRMIIMESIKDGHFTASEVASHIKDSNCLDGKCDSKATSYILVVLKSMLQTNEIILDSDKGLFSINNDYEFMKTISTPEFEVLDKFILEGNSKIKLSRTEHFFSAWSKLYVGQVIEVQLVPEVTNPADSNAVAVFYLGKQIGYLPREISALLADFIINKTNQGLNVMASGEVIKQAMMGTKNCMLSVPTQ